jgi:hypothetical protein
MTDVYGPRQPTRHDLWDAQAAPYDANLAGCSDAEYDRLVLQKQQTEAAYREAHDRNLARALEVEELDGDSLGTYDGQPVMEGTHGRLVYDAEPATADGCIVPCPPNFLGLPRQLEPTLGTEHDWEAGS